MRPGPPGTGEPSELQTSPFHRQTACEIPSAVTMSPLGIATSAAASILAPEPKNAHAPFDQRATPLRITRFDLVRETEATRSPLGKESMLRTLSLVISGMADQVEPFQRATLS